MNRPVDKSTFPPWLPNALTVVVLLMAAFNYIGVFADLDWSWQVRTGGQILETGSLRITDEFSYTIAGTQLHDFEWLYEAVLYLTWNFFGWGGLKFLRVLLVAAPIVIVAYRLRRDEVPWHGIVLAIFACIFALAPVWNLRPLYCTTIGLLLASGMLHEHCSGRKPLSWILPVVMLVWANCHPGVIAGQGLIFGALAWEWINSWVRWNTPLDRAALKRLTLIGLLALAATFVSPDPIERVRYAFKPELAHPIFRIFVEMQPTWAFIAKPPFNFALIYITAILISITIALRFRKFRLWEIAYLAVLTLLANVASRGAMDWFLNLLALGVPHLCILWREKLAGFSRHTPSPWVRRGIKFDNRLKRLLTGPLFRLQEKWLLAGLLGLFVISVIPPISREMPMQTSDEWPKAAVDFMEQTGRGGNVFGPPDLATYVTWRLKDKARCYTDTRGFFFLPILVEDCQYLPQMLPGWPARMERVLDTYPTEYFLLETWGSRGELWRRLEPHIASPLFRDERTVLLSASQVREALPQLLIVKN